MTAFKIRYSPLAMHKKVKNGYLFAINYELNLGCIRHPDGTISYGVKL